ncbi:putative motility protein [Lysinibacillus endophyticus]|uniref:Putative motility protein n=1 Tax=Ureibacillus endophyticus TaxID=1978490 RepID=A0A494Z8M9_9BACL|nr:putative motility protein [Lysinibacillus endophyticus]MCP1143374.1 putative motility protein [Lysinibacillus endophyticus]RKQ19002.1 putative motility protein [Lysinibacillus endophyticus]
MDISSIMSAQVAQLQHTVQLSIMDKALNMGAASAVEMLNQLPQQQASAANHPYKGTVIDVSV